MDQSEAAAADALRRLALDERAKAYVLAQPELYVPLHRAVAKYIGGQTLDACRDVVQQINEVGQATTIDYMGESTRNREDAAEATAEFIRIARTIADYGLEASVSLDLSHVGLVVNEAFCIENMSAIAKAAQEAGTEVMISAEGPDRTDAVLRVHDHVCKKFENVGITIQAFLYRSANDIQALLGRTGKVRIVKGAFDAPPDLAMSRGATLDAQYIELVCSLVGAHRRCSVATHDPEIIEAIIPGVEGADVEFEMLKGVCPDHLTTLKDRGFPTRVYVPYGRDWFLYLLNRLAEHPPGLFDAVAAMAGPNQLQCKGDV